MDGNSSLPVSCSCFQLLKPSFDEVNHHCSLGNDPFTLFGWLIKIQYIQLVSVLISLWLGISDVLPILIEEASFPEKHECPFHSSHVSSLMCIVQWCFLSCFCTEIIGSTCFE